MLLKYFTCYFKWLGWWCHLVIVGEVVWLSELSAVQDWLGRVESGVSLLQINSLISARPRCYHCSLLDEELEKQRSNEGTLLTETQIYLKPFIPTLWSRMLTNIILSSFHPDPDFASLYDPQPPSPRPALPVTSLYVVSPSSAPSLRD